VIVLEKGYPAVRVELSMSCLRSTAWPDANINTLPQNLEQGFRKTQSTLLWNLEQGFRKTPVRESTAMTIMLGIEQVLPL
jgi:hypothetical protein